MYQIINFHSPYKKIVFYFLAPIKHSRKKANYACQKRRNGCHFFHEKVQQRWQHTSKHPTGITA